MKIESYSVQGTRPRQEDSFCFEEFPEGGFLAAVADGFWKVGKDKTTCGSFVSSLVIETLSERITGREPATISFFQHLDHHIFYRTISCVGGSTLALAYRQSAEEPLVFLARGDSIIVSLPRDPDQDLEIYPARHLKRGESGLWNCYGDRENQDLHLSPAEIRHPNFLSRLVLIASDGFYPVLIQEGESPEKKIATLACLYMEMLLDGLTLSQIYEEVWKSGSTDNATAIAVWT